MLDTETKRRIDTARDILVGKVPDPKSQVEQITIALIYKFMDDMDAEAEELGGKRKFFSGKYERYSWKKLMSPSLGGQEVLNLYAEAIQQMNINANIPQLFRDIFKNAYLPYRDPETLKSFLKIIDDFNYEHSEKLGDAFEYLLSVLGSQGDAGQFRTPRHIIDLMVYLIDPKKNETILDPACGTAGFLISSFKHIVKNNSSCFNQKNEITFGNGDSGKYNGDKLTPDERKQLAINIKGYDISPDMVRLSLVNLYLHGFADPKIVEYDTLTSEEKWNEHADIIMANPPFMSPKGGIKPHKRFSVESNRSEVLFVDYIAEHLSPNGRAAVIVPEGIIFQSGTAYKSLRKMLVDKYLYAVVSLPAGLFNPYSGVKTSILLMDKTLSRKTDKILFAKIENDGYDLGAQRRANTKGELPAIASAIKAYIKSVNGGIDFNADELKNLVIASKEKIGENEDWNLSGERYRLKITGKSKVITATLDEIAEIEYGYTTTAKDSGDARFVRITDINERGELKKEDFKYIDLDDRSSEYLLKKGDVLVARTGATFGKTMVFEEDYKAIFASYLIRINLNKGVILSKFYWNFTQTDLYWEQANRLVTGGGQPQFNGNALKQIQIPLPSLEIQKEIVTEIEGWQKIINGARQVVENYKPEIQIDPNWEMVELSHIIKLSSGKGLTSNNIIDGKYPVYGGNGINGYHNEYFLEEPTIVIGRVGAYCGAVHLTQAHSWVTDNGLYVTDLLSKINIKYLAQMLTQLNLNQYAKVGGQPSISQKTVTELKIAVPELKVQDQIVKRIEKELQIVNSNKELITIFEKKIKDKIASVWGE